jgi:anti-sigma regulatory factor (Ser/Thr protein kinase)
VEDLSLHVLDIAENAVTAGARRVDIRVTEDEKQDLLTIEVEDDGKGMDEGTLKKSTDPFFTMRTGAKVGLGLPLLMQSAAECNGGLEVSSRPGHRTLVRATFRNSHIDRKPLGDMTQTLCALVSGHPEVRFTYAYRKGETEVFFDTDAVQGKMDLHNDIERGPDSEKVEP